MTFGFATKLFSRSLNSLSILLATAAIGVSPPVSAAESPAYSDKDSDHSPLATPGAATLEFRLPTSILDFGPGPTSGERTALGLIASVQPPAPVPQNGRRGGLQWGNAINQSLFFTGIQHATRMIELETREGLKGPFFQDWFDSVAVLADAGWDDGGHDFTNYVGHPAAGSAWAFIYRQNHNTEKTLQIAWNRRYLSHIAKAAVWSFLWSLQFEIGPLSEASLGNTESAQAAWVDIVATPAIGVGIVSVGEDALDRFVIQKLEKRTTNKYLRGALRVTLNPTRSFAKLMGLTRPWHRDHR